MYGCSVLWHLFSNQSQLLVLFAYMANCFRSHVDTNDIFIKSYEIAIGGSYKKQFFEEFVMKRLPKENSDDKLGKSPAIRLKYVKYWPNFIKKMFY